MLSKNTVNKLFIEAKKARENAYSPYSKFKVGSAVLTGDNKIFSGSNVENSVYGATVCAERIAIFKAVNEGYRKINAISIVANKMDGKNFTKPCGICRQVLSEFGDDIKIYLSDSTLSVREIINLIDIFPEPFHL